MQWHLRHGRRATARPTFAGTLKEPTPLHTGQRPEPLHALQIPVAIKVAPCDLEKVSSGSLAADFSEDERLVCASRREKATYFVRISPTDPHLVRIAALVSPWIPAMMRVLDQGAAISAATAKHLFESVG